MAPGVKKSVVNCWWILGGIAAVLVLVAVGSAGLTRAAGPDIQTAEVRRGEFVDYVQFRGEVKAIRSVVLTAPPGAGDIQILKLLRSGTMVKAGDVVAEFDATMLQRQVEQRRSELRQTDAEIARTRAQWRLTEEQNLTDLAAAKYNLERAKLDLSKAEILSAIDAEKARLAVSNAEQRLREIEERLEANRVAAEAEIESRKQRREKTLADLRLAENRVAALTLRAPRDGLVAILPNLRSRFGFSGASPPEFKEGDRAWPGAAIAEIPDLSTVRVNGRVEEIDRGRVKLGQEASVRVDALPDRELTGRVADISPLAKPDFSGWPPTKNFDLAIQLDQTDSRLRPGMSATARVAVERIPDSLLVPAEAVFTKGGRTVVYVEVRRGFRRQFEEREVQIARRGLSQLSIARGLQPGERVATKDPTLEGTEE
jgi:multidrug efflux pump subunit AcrA (membrane-fusion protein)